MTALAELRAALGDADASLAELLAELDEARLDRLLARFTEAELAALYADWKFWARPKQLPPPEPWTFWGVRSGRGFGKTRTGAEWVHERAMAGDGRRWIALVERTPADARDSMLNGPGGILKVTPSAERPHYEPSKRRLTWPSGAWATIYSGENPKQARGFSGDTAWFEELAAYQYPRETWDNVLFGVREARVAAPKILVTTTPRPIELMRELIADKRFRWTEGSSYENRANLDPVWFADIISRYEGTTLGEQEILGRLLEESPGALWKRAWIKRRRPPDRELLKSLVRIIVGVDPHATTGRTGVVVFGVAEPRPLRGFVLADRTTGGSPATWARAAIDAYDEFGADLIVGEANNGGDMVEHTIRSVAGGEQVAYTKVFAARGKTPRAQPVASCYEQGRVAHCGSFPELEDQLTNWVAGEGDSPNNLDALVWAATAAFGLTPAPAYEQVFEDQGGFIL